MSSRKEEERNEKIIRGLMKLPPNQRCINCYSLGPQYVCTNFWTFICMTCSGIHREFTHRVKSVSMSKFTSQEVESLQKGGNQRAREIYLKHWDSQRHRLPNNSNVDKVREFIRNVYLDKKYAGGGTSDRPPRDMMNGRIHEEETRRASSYHSYSQSPPYDFHYEERQFGKHAPILTRKPGSDRGLYDGKISNFLSPSRLSDRSPSRLSDRSPSRLSDLTYEDSFVNEQPNSRNSDFSVSSGGDRFRSNVQSPNFQIDVGSPSSETSRDFSSEDASCYTGNPHPDSFSRRSSGRVLHSQRSTSSGSFGSFDSNSLAFKSVNSVGLLDVACEHEQSVEVHDDKKSSLSSLPQPSISVTSDGSDLFHAPFASENVTSTPLAVKETQLPGFQIVDLFQPPTSTAPTFAALQPSQPIPASSLNMVPEISLQRSAANFSDKSIHFVPQNEGWATFDTPQKIVPLGAGNSTAAEIPPEANSVGNFNPLLSSKIVPFFEDNSASLPPTWNTNLKNGDVILSTTNTESWSAFEDSCEEVSKCRERVAVVQPSFAAGCLSIESKGIDKGGIPTTGRESVPQISNVLLSTHDSSLLPAMAGNSNALERKSTNPFDLPCDAETNCEDMSQFWDMSSLQYGLLNVQTPSPFTVGANQHWFAQDPIVPAGPEEAFGFIGGRAPSTQIANVPFASISGNPFV